MTAHLPKAEWTQRASLAKLVETLGADDIRWVGGCVRDTMLDYRAHDIDAATRHLPATVIDRCKDAGIRTIPTGIDHGTVTAIFDDGNVEITTLRRDVATDGRRATIAFSHEWKDDAARRDFTINALYAHPETLEISDYFGGLADLSARRVRFIGDAETRIQEDHLRILRYFRFATRFGDGWDEEATAACSALAPTLKGLSRERVGWEMQNLLALPDPSATIAKMRALGVLQEVLPECGRRATIAFSHEWKDDAARRDFTINALYAHPQTLEISDYFGGLTDLSARRVRFIGDAETRIQEDHLRILRYFRFATRFGDGWDEEATAACSALAPTLKGLSRERVGWEMQNLLALPDPSATIAKMRALGVLQEVLPECGRREVDQLGRLIEAERAADIEPDAMRRMAALLPAVPPVAEAVSARLRLSRSQRDRLMCVARRDARDGDRPRGLAYDVGKDCALDRLLIAGKDPSSILGWEAPRFPLKGGEIVARGVGKGPEVARILQRIEKRWVDEQFPPRTRVEELLDEELAAR